MIMYEKLLSEQFKRRVQHIITFNSNEQCFNQILYHDRQLR